MSYKIYHNEHFFVELTDEEFTALRQNNPSEDEIKLERKIYDLEDKLDIKIRSNQVKDDQIAELKSKNKELSSDISARVQDIVTQVSAVAKAGTVGEKYGKK